MPRLARRLVIVFLAVFAASAVIHVASATTMSVEMAFLDNGATDMTHCEGCDSDAADDKGGISCDIACTAPVAASVSMETAPIFSSFTPDAVQISRDFAGRTGAPDPFPPRPLILS